MCLLSINALQSGYRPYFRRDHCNCEEEKFAPAAAQQVDYSTALNLYIA